MPIAFDTVQYRARPLGRVNEKNAIISGINHSIIAWLPAWRGSVDGCIVIFCWTQVVAKTNTGMMILVGSGSARFSHRNPGSNGAAVNIGAIGIQVYILSDRLVRLSGRENTT